MNVGDIVIDFNEKKYIVYTVDNHFIYVVDFETQIERIILLEQEIKEVVEKPKNVEFMFLRRREKNIIDIKRYL